MEADMSVCGAAYRFKTGEQITCGRSAGHDGHHERTIVWCRDPEGSMAIDGRYIESRNDQGPDVSSSEVVETIADLRLFNHKRAADLIERLANGTR